jgi:uncharacterized protein
MKTIWIDICHPAQLNFYLNIIKLLIAEHLVIVTVLNRGKLPVITKKELQGLPGIRLIVVGRHRGTRMSAIFESNLIRLILLFWIFLTCRIDIHFSNGFHGSVLSNIFRFPSITFGDDPNTADYRPKLIFSNKVFYCLYTDRFVNISKKANILKCVKEWAYLNPLYFQPDIKALTEYGLKPHAYIFVREVSTGTMNYAGQKAGLVHSVQGKIPDKYKVLLSLEDKSRQHLYPDNWILLQEPIQDIHSLIYYSRTFISSGDSMAREAAVLGNPAIYLGIRTMPANEVLKEMVDFYQVGTQEFPVLLNKCLQNFSVTKKQKNINKLSKNFMDINKFVLEITKKILN